MSEFESLQAQLGVHADLLNFDNGLPEGVHPRRYVELGLSPVLKGVTRELVLARLGELEHKPFDPNNGPIEDIINHHGHLTGDYSSIKFPIFTPRQIRDGQMRANDLVKLLATTGVVVHYMWVPKVVGGDEELFRARQARST